MFQLVTLARWEWFRLSKRPSALALLALAVLIALAALVFTVGLNAGWSFLSGEFGYFPVAAGTLSIVSPLLAIILAAFVHGMDLQGGGGRTLVARGNSRVLVLGSKALTCFLVLLAYHLVVTLLATLFSLVPSANFLEWQDGIIDVGASLLDSLLYLSLGMALAHWRQSVAFTIGVGVALIFAEATFYPIAVGLADFIDWPVRNFTAWTLWGISRGLRGDSFLFGGVWYIPIVLGYALALASLSLLSFIKADLKSGE